MKKQKICLFPVRIKQHSMEIRDQEKYEVNHANTERMKKSSIPYMQRLLNKNVRGNNVEENQPRIRRPG